MSKVLAAASSLQRRVAAWLLFSTYIVFALGITYFAFSFTTLSMRFVFTQVSVVLSGIAFSLKENFWPWLVGALSGMMFGGVIYLLFTMVIDLQEQVTQLRDVLTSMNTLQKTQTAAIDTLTKKAAVPTGIHVGVGTAPVWTTEEDDKEKTE